MSAGGAFGGARGYQPRPPEKGVFPLDHFGECESLKDAYLSCLKRNSNKADACRDDSKRYLECRMQRNLMAQQDLKELGFDDKPSSTAAASGAGKSPDEADQQRRKQQGFVAGIRR